MSIKIKKHLYSTEKLSRFKNVMRSQFWTNNNYCIVNGSDDFDLLKNGHFNVTAGTNSSTFEEGIHCNVLETGVVESYVVIK